jgi:hypothetical protein
MAKQKLKVTEEVRTTLLSLFIEILLNGDNSSKVSNEDNLVIARNLMQTNVSDPAYNTTNKFVVYDAVIVINQAINKVLEISNMLNILSFVKDVKLLIIKPFELFLYIKIIYTMSNLKVSTYENSNNNTENVRIVMQYRDSCKSLLIDLKNAFSQAVNGTLSKVSIEQHVFVAYYLAYLEATKQRNNVMNS